MEQEIINKVAASGLVTLNLEQFFPSAPILSLNIADFLFQGLLLKEKDFREAMLAWNWQQYNQTHLCVYCSTDAIIPMWAYQLIAIHAEPHVLSLTEGKPEDFIKIHYYQQLALLDVTTYLDKRVVIKGCGQQPVPAAAYMEVARVLRPYVKSIMYGEPCSTVPIYKKK
jgi:hypothetical protein